MVLAVVIVGALVLAVLVAAVLAACLVGASSDQELDRLVAAHWDRTADDVWEEACDHAGEDGRPDWTDGRARRYSHARGAAARFRSGVHGRGW